MEIFQSYGHKCTATFFYGSQCMYLKCLFISAMKAIRSQRNLSNQVSKVRIAQQQPAAWCDAIGLVLKLVRPQLVEVTETASTLPFVVAETWLHCLCHSHHHVQNTTSASKVLHFTAQLYGTVGHLLWASAAFHMFEQQVKLIFLQSENPDLEPLWHFCNSGTT